MYNYFIAFFFGAYLFIVDLGCARATEKKVALVIGNGSYQHTPALKNPVNDATDTSEALRALGFTVVAGTNLDKSAMDRKVREFADAVAGAQVGLFFYAGHGLQHAGQNYLVPIDAKLTTASALDFEMIRLDLIQRAMEREARVNILFLDACRDNPLARNLARAMGTRSGEVGRGLASVESGVGTLISFSTQPGNVALDGTGRNSPYAGPLVKHLARQGEDLSNLLIAVRNDVMAATNNRQVPWEHSALTAKFYFSPPKLAPSVEAQFEANFWGIVKNSDNPAVLLTYLDRYPKGTYADIARALIEQRQQELYAAKAAREVEERKAEQARRTADAEQLQRAIEEARKAKDAALAAEERSRIAQQNFEHARAASETAKSSQISALASNVEVAEKSIPQLASLSRFAALAPEELAKELLKELRRVGCDPGTTDGRWGDKADAALRRFVRYTKVDVALDGPSPEALDIVSAQRVRICPLECASGQHPVGDRCVAKIPATKSATVQVQGGGNCRAETREECRVRYGLSPHGQGTGLGPCRERLVICK